MGLRNQFIIFCCIFVGACSVKEKKAPKNLFKTPENKNFNFDQFSDSKGVIGEVGRNGEVPDTLIFSSRDSVTYVSTDTGKEKRPYYFKEDTLVFESSEFIIEGDNPNYRKQQQLSMLVLENNTLKYVYDLTKFEGEKVWKKHDLQTLDLSFRKIK